MTDVQKRLMELMDDIEMICQEKNLQYVLFGRTAILAKNSGKFVDGQYDFDIMMPLADVIELMKYTEEHLSETRAIESWYDNPYLKQMIFRFVDKNSTLWDDTSGHYYTKPGVAVTIFVTRPQTFDGKVYGAERYVMLKNNNGGKLPYSVFQLKKMEQAFREDPEKAAADYNEPHIEEIVNNTGGLRWGYIRSLFMSDRKMLLWVLDKYLSAEKTEGGFHYYMTRNGGWHKLPADIYEDPEPAAFEDRTVRNSRRYHEFMTILYGKDWESREIKTYAVGGRIRVIEDCELPYEEFVSFSKDRGRDMKTMMDEMTVFNRWKDRDFRVKEAKVVRTFARVRRSVERIDVWYKLRKKRKALRNSAKAGDIERMKRILREYLVRTNRYRDMGIGFYIDDEIFSFAKMIWEDEGRQDYASSVYELVPDLYKNETVEEYLKKKGAI